MREQSAAPLVTRHSSLVTALALAILLSGIAFAATAPMADIHRAAGKGGIVVQIGCGDGTLTADLTRAGTLLVHALEADWQNVEKARRLLQERGLYGVASVEHWTLQGLPYADNTANIVVACVGKTDEDEIRRVLAPGGSAWIASGSSWKTLRKSWPKDFDEWTHWRHGADGNMVSRDSAVTTPTGLRWVAGPPQDAYGKKWYYDHVLLTAGGRSFYQYETQLVARDSFNSQLLWTREMKAVIFKEGSLGVRTSKVRPVVTATRVYVIDTDKLVALDAATGETVSTIAPVETPREILLENSVLLVSDKSGVRAFGLDGKQRWARAGQVRRMVAGEGKVFCVSGDAITRLDLESGKEEWSVHDFKASSAMTLTYGKDVLVLERAALKDGPKPGVIEEPATGVLVYSAKDGQRLWMKTYFLHMHYQEARAFFAQDLLWLLTDDKKKLGGYDPQTGKKIKEMGTVGSHCAVPVATTRYLIAPEMEFTDFKTGAQTRGRMAKSGCRMPFIPANGLLYTFPVQCECFPMLHGYMALSQTHAIDSDARIESGVAPASVPAASDAGATSKPDSAWPMYRHDVWRSGAVSAEIDLSGAKTLWHAQVAPPRSSAVAAEWSGNPFVDGIITQPVAAAECVFVAVPDLHRVDALDARKGTKRWSFTAGGRIDTPPTISDGLCLFGSHDGWVYCLSAADGKLVWRFRAAPKEGRIMAYGQLESIWPVAGSVLVENGTVFCAAGRQPMCDGGVYVYALNAHTGEMVWKQNINDMGMKSWYSAMMPAPNEKRKIGLDYEAYDLLVKDGDMIAMSRWRLNSATGECKVNPTSLEYQAPGGLSVPRGLWSYGIRQTKMVEEKPPAVFDQKEVHTGGKGDVALLLIGKTLLVASANGDLTMGKQTNKLDSPAIHDGMIAAYGRVYVATRDGKVLCVGKD
ncbi:MAG TPA: PQQ-binding-like beta-propeller repeat protein [Planctomycetota bacterium]